MREIRFNFVYGIDGREETYFNKTFTFGEIENGDHVDEIFDNPLTRDYAILGKRQWTGLQDKHGKDIFEKDFCESGAGNLMLIDFRGGSFVAVHAPSCRTEMEGEPRWDYLDKHCIECYQLQIVGNQFEHPNLLSEGE